MSKVKNREYKEIYDKENNLILRIKRPVWISDDTVNICHGCRQYFSPFRRKHHCRNCGNIFCQNCSSNTVSLPYLGYHRYVRVCKRCLKLVEFLNKCLDKTYSIVDIINDEYDIINSILNGDEYTIQHFINYGGISILNYFSTLNYPAFCHIFIGIILVHLSKYELSEQSDKDLLDIFIKLSNLYIEHMNEIVIDTQYLLFLFQNFVIYLMNTLIKAENSNIIENKEVDIIKILLRFCYLDFLYEKIHKENYDNHHYIVLVSTIEKIVSKSLSEFCKKKQHQYAIFQNPELIDLFYKGLSSNNDEARKYLAKSLAYLSLRNDQYKLLILKGSGKDPVKDHVDTLIKCIILDPEKFPDILTSFCNCCYSEYIKENAEAESASYLSHSYSPKRSSFHKKSPLSISLRNSTSNYSLKHNRHRSASSSTPGSPIIKKQINLAPKVPAISNLTKGLNSPHYRTIPTSPLSKSSISNNFDDLLTPPTSNTTSKETSLNGTPSPSPPPIEKLSLNETRNKINNTIVLDDNMIQKLKFNPETLFTTNVLNTYLNEQQNHTSTYNLTHDLISYNTMICHIVCTLANLICQSECEELIMENDQIIYVLCLLIEYHVKLITNSLQNKQISPVKVSTSLDIARHASRALGNIALNQNNIEMLFSLCTTKQPHIISALYSLLSLNDETIQRQTLRIISNIYSKKSINDLTLHSDTINSNLDTIQALIPQDSENSNNSSSFLLGSSPSSSILPKTSPRVSPRVSPKISPTSSSKKISPSNLLSVSTNINIPLSASPKSKSLSPLDPFDNDTSFSSIKSSSSDNKKSFDRNSYSSLPPLFDDGNSNNEDHSHKNMDKEFRRSSLQSHLNLTAPAPINNNVMMSINPDSLVFLYHIKYILRFITIANYCKDYGCTLEIKRKATSVLNKLKIIVKNYNSNIKKLNQI